MYGEITFKTLALALHKIKTKYGLPGVGSSGKEGVLQGNGGAFYDIGSGTGKPVRCFSSGEGQSSRVWPFGNVSSSGFTHRCYAARSSLLAATSTTTVVADFLCVFDECAGYRGGYLPFVRKGSRD